ncbi:glycosyltransferase family 2 protein [uncultured Agrococcus sp.]|uniref:glycosyltransferase family 2 protein n=1 Tax=uncultured Agrococcus sp. TaxID=382258 RepID=UPI0025EF9FEB|nr:glycosyltransferase family 2 protein [uncultured Agrococcus sp.]
MTGPSVGRALEPRLSVIIPAFNVEDWIGLTLESILGASEQSLEVLVVDDGSTDETKRVVEDVAARDARVRPLQNPGKGGAQARNFAIGQANGEFLAFSDGDDLVPQRAYEYLLQQADASGNDMVIGNHVTSEPQRLVQRSSNLPLYREARAGLTLVDEPLFLRDRVCWNRIIRRSTWQRLGLEFADSRRSNDIQAMTRAYCLIPFDVIPEPVYVYRRRVGSTSMTSNKLRSDALRDHFTQELACCDAVTSLGDKQLSDRYFAGILEFDVWAHGREVALQDDVEFDRVRELMLELVTRASRDAVRSLPVHHRLFYNLVGRGDWEAARIVVGAQGRTMADALDRVDAAGIVRAAIAIDGKTGRVAAWLVRASYLKAIVDDPGRSDEQIVSLQRKARALVRVGLPKSAFEWRDRQILLANSADANAIREAARKPEPFGVMYVARRVRGVLARVSKADEDRGAPTPGQMLSMARRVRPRHVRNASGVVVRAARRRLGR